MKLTLLLVLSFIFTTALPALEQPSFVLTNVQLPHFETRTLSPVHIEVDNGKIKRIVSADTSLTHPNTRDGQGKVILPAMIDMHSHSMGNTSLDRSDYQYIGIRGSANAMLYAGVHGWLDLFSDEHDILHYRNQRHPRTRNEAFVFAAGPCFTVPNGHCDYDTTRLISTPKEARDELYNLSLSKPDVVKVVYDHHLKRPTLDKATFKAFIDTANELGIKSVVHVGNWKDIKIASVFGASAVTHIPTTKMPEGMAKLLAKNGTVVIPTTGVISELLYMHKASSKKLTLSVLGMELTRTLVDESLLQDYPVSEQHPGYLAWLNRLNKRDATANMKDAIMRLNAAGVTILVGSDSANLAMFQGVGFHRELFHLQQYGLSPWQLVNAASHQSYAFLGIDWQLTTGADAHFTLHDAAIFDDISYSANVADIYLFGRKIEREPLLYYAKPGFFQYAKLFFGLEY